MKIGCYGSNQLCFVPLFVCMQGKKVLRNYNPELTKRLSKFVTLEDFRTQVSVFDFIAVFPLGKVLK